MKKFLCIFLVCLILSSCAFKWKRPDKEDGLEIYKIIATLIK